MDLLPVRILGRDPSNFTWEVGIDAGTDDGVSGRDAGGGRRRWRGCAGRQRDRGRRRSQRRSGCVVDARSSVVALDQQTRALGLVQGQLGGQLVMVQVQATDEVAVGDTIVSAGLTLTDAGGAGIGRSPYPRGLLIGTIQALELDPDGLTQIAFVRPALDFAVIESPPRGPRTSTRTGSAGGVASDAHGPIGPAAADQRGMGLSTLAQYGGISTSTPGPHARVTPPRRSRCRTASESRSSPP